MNNLRETLQSLLKSIHPDIIVGEESISRVYFQYSSSKAIFPYIVYDLPNSFTDEEQEIFNLDMDIYDNQSDSTNLEQLTNLFWKKLHYYSYIDDNIQFTIYRENRLPPFDEDKRLKRRKLIFQLRYYDRGLNDE
ncbi:hypothetical protein BKP37_12710 [Anaerobacillus alkalilacustris]|uniref:DUF3168 domain-containing protein n=1 Tax=Anaerobacillus alkalilacustris TaxID=393763 RepID=A0A1S2LJF1_9BACI|nr:hypothetical protein [Anaerobacillus alkalilacustris]OIJ12658.1 hypothetical protein BKP37_12710 [Anaerobacillus alkalilacustris]